MFVYLVREERENRSKVFSTREKAIKYAVCIPKANIRPGSSTVYDYEDGDTSVCRDDGFTFWITKEMVE